jgi:IPT/TIG domain
MRRSLSALLCSALLLSACSKSTPAKAGVDRAALAAATNWDPPVNLRSHSSKAYSKHSPAKLLRKQAAHGKVVPNIVGGTSQDENSGPAGLTYNSGPMLQSPEVYAVFWGSSVAPEVVQGVPGFFATAFTDAPFMQGVNEYNATTSYVIGDVTYRGEYTDADAPAGTNSTITDFEIQKELARLLDTGALPAPNGHNIFMIYFPPGLTIDQGGGTNSCEVFCAYHGGFTRNNQPVYYAIMPDLTQGTCAQVCGAGTPINNEYSASSHELIEATTDANVSFNQLAWYDFVDGSDGIGGEVGDICVSWDGTSNGYNVQSMWSNESNSCRAGKSTGSAALTINLKDKPLTPAILDATNGVTVNVPITLTVPAIGGGTAAKGPFTFASPDLGTGFTTTFTPATLDGSGNTQLAVHIPPGIRSQNLAFLAEAIDADGAHHFGQGEIGLTGAAPTVTSYTPTSGGGGTQVVVTGTNWGVGSTVVLCPATGACPSPVPAAGGYVSGSAGQTVVFTAPVTSVTGPVKFVLANLNDASHALSIDFTYNKPNPAPVVTGTSPSAGPSSGENFVIIEGSNFAPQAVVTIDGTPIDVNDDNVYEYVDSQTIYIIMPPASAPDETYANITVTNGDAQVSAPFTGYLYADVVPPKATALSVTTGPTSGGTYVTIDGENFTSPVTVSFGSTPATVLTSNPSFLTLRTPAHAAGDVAVTIVNSDSGTTVLSQKFTYVASTAPAITSVSPSWGVTAGGTEVVITGTNLDSNALVTFDGTAALVAAGSSTSLTVTTPAHAAGSAPLVIKNGDGQTATSTFLYSDSAPADMAVGSVDMAAGPTDMAKAASADMAKAASADMATGGHKGGGGSTAGDGSPASSVVLLFGAALLALALRRRFLA